MNTYDYNTMRYVRIKPVAYNVVIDGTNWSIWEDIEDSLANVTR